MDLVLFDIDGTLIDSMDLEDQLFTASIMEFFDLPAINTNWASYQHVSDRGVADEVSLGQRGRPITEAELIRLEDDFVRRLEACQSASTHFPGEIKGACSFVKFLEDSNIAVAMATGGFRRSALLKLKAIGLERFQNRLATSNDSADRTKIMRKAVDLASGVYRTKRFDRICYLGDGIWDLEAAQSLQWNFIAIGKEFQSLMAKGADAGFRDFSDHTSMLEIMMHDEQLEVTPPVT